MKITKYTFKVVVEAWTENQARLALLSCFAKRDPDGCAFTLT